MAYKESDRPGVMIYFDVLPCLERLTREEMGALFEAIMNYARFGIFPELNGVVGIAFDFIRPRIDADAENYENKKEARKRAALTRWHGSSNAEDANASDEVQNMPTTATTTTTTTTTATTTASTAASTSERKRSGCVADKPPKNTTTFSFPTREEVKAYCKSQGFPIDWEYFYDYYSGNGWKTGKNQITDWKAVLRNWARKEPMSNKRIDVPELKYGRIGTIV